MLSRPAAHPLPDGTQKWIFVAFALAFLIKMPAFPFHGWMPDAYGSMPLPALAVFSGVVSKVAAYGFLRDRAAAVPGGRARLPDVLLILALLSILYGSVQAFTQTNARLILGYSSVAQLGFITLGIFAIDRRPRAPRARCCRRSTTGSSSRRCSSIIVLLAERAGGSEDIRDMGGIAFRAPVLAGLFLVVALATLAMPGSANFVGEFLILLGVFNSKLAIALIASIGVILASVYALRHVHPRDAQPRPGRRCARSSCGRPTRSCSCRWCWRSWRSRCSRSGALKSGERAVGRASVRACRCSE